MTASAWVPPGTLSPALDRDLATVASGWGDAWFGCPLTTRDGAGDDLLYVAGADVAVGLAGEAPGAMALGSRFAGTRNATDRALLDRVGDAAREDVLRRVAAVLAVDAGWHGPVAQPAWEPARTWRFGDPTGRLSLTIHLGERCLATAILARLPTVAAPGRSLTPLSRVMAGRAVRLSARLGRCTLRLAEMRGMMVGDTLLFDRGVDDPLPVVIDDAAAAVATARVVREPAHWSLAIDTSRLGKAA